MASLLLEKKVQKKFWIFGNKKGRFSFSNNIKKISKNKYIIVLLKHWLMKI